MTDFLLVFLAWCAGLLHALTSIPPPVTADDQNWFFEFFDGFTWTQGGIIIAALIAATGVMATIVNTSGRARRDRLADMYAEALSGVSQYIEGPYRIRRRTIGNPEQRVAITTFLSDVKSRIDHAQNMLDLHARAGVADAYRAYVLAAMREAGQQMHEAWKLPGIKHDSDVNLHVAYTKVESDLMRVHVVAVMKSDLAFRWRRPRTWSLLLKTVKAAAAAAKEAEVAARARKAAATKTQTAYAVQSPAGVLNWLKRVMKSMRHGR